MLMWLFPPKPSCRPIPEDVSRDDYRSDPRPPKRHRLVNGLIVLTAAIMLVTALGTWVKRQALDTDNWVDASDEILADPEIRAALSTFIVNELYRTVDVGAARGTPPGEPRPPRPDARHRAPATGDERRRSPARHRAGADDLERHQPASARVARAHPAR